MKRIAIVTLLLASVAGVFGQGSVNFNNRVTTGTIGDFNGPIYAPVWGINPANPTQVLVGQGNAADPTGGGPPIPLGTTDYSGRSRLSGTGFTAQLWGGTVAGGEAGLSLMAAGAGTATTTFRTTTATMGAVVLLADAASINGIPGGPGTRGLMQLRAWDNLGGTITTWAAVLANPAVARGASPVFTPNFDLGGNGSNPPNLIGLQSFGLYIVPEPSLIALGALSLGALLLRRNRKQS